MYDLAGVLVIAISAFIAGLLAGGFVMALVAGGKKSPPPPSE